MSYRIYHTEGLILQTKPLGDAHMMLIVLTKDMGLLLVRATSLRLNASRLRYVLQKYAHAKIDVVRGKHGWRLTSAQTISTQSRVFRHPFRRIALAAISELLLRLIHGENPHPELYIDVIALIRGLGNLTTRESCGYLELLSVARILHFLGYFSLEKDQEWIVSPIEKLEEMLAQMKKQKKQIVEKISRALTETQL